MTQKYVNERIEERHVNNMKFSTSEHFCLNYVLVA
jgi:hypothetical protein